MMRLRTVRRTKSNDDGNEQPDGQRNERRNRAVGHDAVVDVHDEEGRRQRKDVHQQCRRGDMHVVRPKALHDRPEPMLAGRIAGGGDMGVGYDGRPDQDRVTDIVGGLGAQRDGLRVGRSRWVDHLRQAWIAIDLVQNPRAAVPHDDHGGQHQRRDVGELAFVDLDFQSGAGCGPLIERDRQLAVGDRKAGEQRRTGQRAAMVRREIQDAVGERVGNGRRSRRRLLDGLGRHSLKGIHER